MLTGIGLRNFKAFGDEMQEAPLSKITLIYGPNSGGKSSIIQALLLLKQSLKSEYADGSRILAPRGELADLGSVQSLVHKHSAQELSIGLKYRNLEIGDNVAENDVSLTYSNMGRLSKVSYKVTAHGNGKILLQADATENYDFPFTLSAWNAQIRIMDIDGNKIVHFVRSFLPFLAVPELADGRKQAQEQSLSTELERMVTVSEPTLKRTLEAITTEDLQALVPDDDEARARRQALAQERARRQALALSLEMQSQKQTLANDLKLERVLVLKWEQKRVCELNEELEQTEERIAELEEKTVDIEEFYERESVLPTRTWELEKELERVKERAWEPGLERLEGADELKLELSEQNLTPQQILDLTPENIPADYERHLHSVNYLAPLRSTPQRLYRISSENDDSAGITGIQGEFSANVLYHNEEVLDDVNLWFEQFEIPYELNVAKLGETSLSGEHITIALTDKRTETQVTLADVGYGINQILPVIIEGIASQESAILCVEQPEIHLHPRLQANIADLMIDTIANERGKRKQWIVETHSELLITRIQRRIREGKIGTDDISVLYVDPSDDNEVEGSAILRLKMDENGDFVDHWPHGFFDEAFNELMAEPENQLHSAD